jgi:mannose-1-phosphate guanylyltransferase
MVSEHHRRFWPQARWTVQRSNIVVQPANRGTAHGILLAVLSILARDPLARIVFLPADHYVRDELALAVAIRSAADSVRQGSQGLTLVGFEPDEPDPELGYIVPGARLTQGTYSVERFVEKPSVTIASQLLAAGALWNSFIFAADVVSLLELFRQQMPDSVHAMVHAMVQQDSVRALAELYSKLPTTDFSRSITQGSERALRVVAAPSCGWSDLGTPKRVADTLSRLDLRGITATSGFPDSFVQAPAFINLAAQHARLGRINWGTTP